MCLKFVFFLFTLRGSIKFIVLLLEVSDYSSVPPHQSVKSVRNGAKLEEEQGKLQTTAVTSMKAAEAGDEFWWKSFCYYV